MDAPAVAVSNDGKKVAAAWMDMRSGPNLRHVQWTVGPAGKFAPEATANDDPKGMQGTRGCAWEDPRLGPNAQRIYAASSKSKNNPAVSGEAEGKCGYPSLAFGGVLGVAYESSSGVSFRVLLEK
jgi:hypothetical protein